VCELIGALESMSRRSLVKKGVVAAGLAAGASMAGPGRAVAGPLGIGDGGAGSAAIGRRGARGTRTRVVLLGTAGGPTWWPGTERSGISSAVVVGDAVYLVDCGDGTGRRYRQAGLAGEADLSSFNQLRAVFLTHLHSDHVADYPALVLFSLQGALGLPDRPVQVFGPGRRGTLPAVFPPGRPVPPPVSPSNPWPGTADMTDLLMQAFATDINDRIRDTAASDPRTRVTPYDIPLPPGADADPNGTPAPPLDVPIEVYEDDRVRVTATLVDHGQVFPSFGYRFDTDDGSVTFSGDTTVTDNLIALAGDTDVLVHEVVDAQWIDETLDALELPEDSKAALRQHLLGAHTTIEQVGPVAEAAGARTLVLSHFGPANNPRGRWARARAGFSGRFRIGEDLMELGVGARRR
jgi:ribonuclease BN (tRNA processing enzyme)